MKNQLGQKLTKSVLARIWNEAAHAAFVAAVVPVPNHLQPTKSVNERSLVLTGQDASARRQMDVMQVRLSRDEGTHVTGFFDLHVIEVAHHADARAVAVATN